MTLDESHNGTGVRGRVQASEGLSWLGCIITAVHIGGNEGARVVGGVYNVYKDLPLFTGETQYLVRYDCVCHGEHHSDWPLVLLAVSVSRVFEAVAGC